MDPMDPTGAVALLHHASLASRTRFLGGTLVSYCDHAVEQRLSRAALMQARVRITGDDPGPLGKLLGRTFGGDPTDRTQESPDSDTRTDFRVEPGPLPVTSPFRLRELLDPGWLLVGYELTVTGTDVVEGRPAVAVTATTRPAAVPEGQSLITSALDRIDLLVDAELGILLSRTDSVEGEVCRIDRLLALDPSPRPSDPPSDPPSGPPLEDAGWEGLDVNVPEPVRLVAQGLGSVLGGAMRAASRFQHRPDRPDDEPWFSTAEPAVAANGRLPGAAELARLLHRSGRDRLPFTAELHQWRDARALARSARDNPVVGDFVPTAVLHAAVDTFPDRTHTVTRLTVADLLHYRLDQLRKPHPRLPDSLACDGTTGYHLFPDRLVTLRPDVPEFAVAQVLDLSWLLLLDLTPEGWTEQQGRRALRLTVRDRDRSHPSAQLLFADRMEVLVDAELGIGLRLTSHRDGAPVLRLELRNLAAVDPTTAEAGFRLAPPPGGRTVKGSGGALQDTGLPGPVQAVAGAAAVAAGGAAMLLGILGNKHRTPPPPRAEPPAASAPEA